MKMSRREMVLRLAQHLFPDHRIVTADNPGGMAKELGCATPAPGRFAEFKAWWDRHMVMSDAEFSAVVVIVGWDAQNFFNQPGAAADFEHSNKLARWSLDEGVALLLCKDPKVVNLRSVEPFGHEQPASRSHERRPASPFAMRYLKTLELALRARQFDDLPDPIRPSELVAWALKMNVPVPPELAQAVDVRVPRTVPVPPAEPTGLGPFSAGARVADEVSKPSESGADTRGDSVERSPPTTDVRSASATAVELSMSTPAHVVRHSTKSSRRNILDPVIELAQTKCTDPMDTVQVWAHLAALAQDGHPPLLAAVAEGLKYSKNGKDAYFTVGALDKRLHPEKRDARQ